MEYKEFDGILTEQTKESILEKLRLKPMSLPEIAQEFELSEWSCREHINQLKVNNRVIRKKNKHTYFYGLRKSERESE